MLAPLIATALIAAPPTPTELFDRVERAFLNARHLAVDARIRAQGSFEADIKTTWKWAPDAKLRLDIDGRLLRAPASTRFVSTGFYMQWPGNLVPVAPDLARGSRLMFIRLGASFNAIRVASGTRPDGLEGSGHHFARVTDIKVGSPEKIGKRSCLPIRFKMLVADEPSGTATLWVDTKTYQPVKRQMEVAFNGGTMKVEETYTKVRKPKRLSDSLFQLY